MQEVERKIRFWKDSLRSRGLAHEERIRELEDHLRDEMEELSGIGLSEDEAFLVAVKRMGNTDSVAREFAKTEAASLWKQLVLDTDSSDGSRTPGREIFTVIILTLLSAVAVKLPELAGYQFSRNTEFYARNLSFFFLPMIAVFYAFKSIPPARLQLFVFGTFIGSFLLLNLYPFSPGGQTDELSSVHLFLLLWFLTGALPAGSSWRTSEGGMDFIRRTGELFIYTVLVYCGRFVLLGFMFFLFSSIGSDLMLALVLGLVLYVLSARPEGKPAGINDAASLVLIIEAVLVNAFALNAILSRISSFGFSPNKLAALGENLLLMGNLLLLAYGYVRIFLGKSSFSRLEVLQTRYLPAYVPWFAFVAFVFPLIFRVS